MNEQMNRPSSSSKAPLYIIIAVLALLLVGGGIGTYVYLSAKEKKEQEQAFAEMKKELEELKEEKEELEEKKQSISKTRGESKATTAPAPVVKKTPPTSGTVSYSGSIGKYSIRMTLNHNSYSGTYYYTRMGAKNKLYLSMSRTGNNISLVESTKDGQITGYFDGRLNTSTGVYSGTFTAHDGRSYNDKLNPIY